MSSSTARRHRASKRFNLIARLVREPFAQFLFIGALIFAVSYYVQESHKQARQTIVVDNAVVKRIAALYQTQMGVPPSPDQVNALVDNYIRSEILYREALRLGLDKNDEIIKRRLVQKMAFLTADSDSFAALTDADVQAYYNAHKADFAVPPKVSFRHVYFRADDPKAEARAAEALRQLTAHPAESGSVGDPFPLESEYAVLSRRSAEQIFGDTPIVAHLFNSPTGTWAGPYKSGYGWHLIYISARTEKTVPPLADISDTVRKAAEAAARQTADEKAYATLKAKYTIIRSATGSETDAKLASTETGGDTR
jgi:parvulin-like peptidyl-prolyl isomerase